MEAIVDNSARDEVFGDNRPPAGEFFFRWLNSGNGRLVVGGKLLKELSRSEKFKKWLRAALLPTVANARRVSDPDVDAETKMLESLGICRSDDEHVLALARVSGARLLFTNDRNLQEDFDNPRLINSGSGRGRVYTTRRHKDVTDVHRSLLS